MKLFCTNTSHGLVPNYDADFDEKKKLKIGEVYKVEVKKTRNYEFHKKYFALINCAWEYMTEPQQAFFKNNIELFRKSMEVSAGYCEMVYNAKINAWIDIPKSISFEKLDNFDFQQVYDSVKNVIFNTALKNISIEEFNTNLINF